MAVKISPVGRQQFFTSQGAVAAGYKLFCYAAGTATKQSTYTDSTGNTANANPIVLDSAGRTPSGLWLTDGLGYKFVLAPSNDTDPPTSAIWSEDNIRGVNDTTTTIDQWLASGLTPTYISATSFSFAGDQTSTFHPGRKIKTTNTGGTVYSRIVSSIFAAVTTIIVENDSGTLDSGLSAVSYGLLSATNDSVPWISETAGFARWSADATGAALTFRKSRGTNGYTIVQDADDLGSITAKGSDGTAFRNAAQIKFEVDGTPGAGDMPGRIVFKVTPDGSSTLAEALRISQDKSILYSGSSIKYGGSGVTLISANTSDAADTSLLQIAGGGAASGTRGALIQIYGNEFATVPVQGALTMSSGDIAGAFVGIGSGTSQILIQRNAGIEVNATTYIGDTANANVTLGLTINQAGNDDAILEFKSSDVAHGVTTVTETDTYAKFLKATGATGGIQLDGISTGAQSMVLRGIPTTSVTGKTTSSGGAIQLIGALKNGTGVTSLGANANILSIQDNGTTRFMLDADGDSHQDVGTAWTNFDAHNDLKLMHALAVHVSRPGDPIKKDFASFLKVNRRKLERLKLVTFNRDGHHFVNMSKLAMLHNGAIRQLGEAQLRDRAEIADLRKLTARLTRRVERLAA